MKRSREERLSEAWHRGILDWKFKPIQIRLYEAFKACKTFLFVSLIARQTGKSYLWSCLAIETAIKKPNARIRYGTAFQSDLEEFILPIFKTILEDCPKPVRPEYKQHGSKFVFSHNASEIKLVGLDKNPDGIRGNALDLVIIDEAGFCDQLTYVYQIILAMLRHRPKLRVVMSSTPPETPDHDFTEFVQQADAEGSLFKATIDDDETCSQETKDRIAKECGGRDSTTWRREFMCEFVVDADLAIVPEWSDEFIAEPTYDEFFPYYHLYASMDIGVVDFTAVLFGFYDFKRATLNVIDEVHIKGPSTTTEKIAELVRSKEHELWPERKLYRRISDNNAPILLNDLSAFHKTHFIATDKDELPAMVNELRIFVKSKRLRVAPKCKMLIGNLKYGIYNSSKIKREFARSKVYGHYDHLAALVYLVRNLDQNTNPIPPMYGIDPATFHVKPEHFATPKQKEWNKALKTPLLRK